MAWGKPSTASPATTASELLAKASATNAIVVLPFRTFADAEMVALCGLLAAAPAITEINSSGKALGAEGAAALGALLSNGRCALRKLAVGDAAFATGGGLQVLAESLVSACPLHVLDLGYKALDGARDGKVALAPLLAHCPDLRDLTLSRNPQLGAEGVSALVASGCLAPARGLTRLELSEGGIDGAAVALLADAAGTGLRSLRELLLARNPAIGADGHVAASALARLLSTLPALRCVHLQECALGEAAASALGAALGAAHTALCELRLCGNTAIFGGDDGGSGGAGGEQDISDGDQDALPTCFIESALPTRVAYEASLLLTRRERLTAERARRQAGERHARSSDPTASPCSSRTSS